MGVISSKEYNIPIVAENDDFIVIDKPAGLIVELSYDSDKTNLKDIIEETYKPSESVSEEEEKAAMSDKKDQYNIVTEFKERSGLVHRLDADTSGVMVIAKTLKGFIHLKNQFLNRLVEKKYIAITYGKYTKAMLQQIVEINAPISRNKKNRTKFMIHDQGKQAVTIFKQIKFYGEEYTIWECIPKTGRTHQIRVHLTALNCPIIGDQKYSGLVRSRRDKGKFDRLFLHSEELVFEDLDGNKVLYTSELPNEFKNFSL